MANKIFKSALVIISSILLFSACNNASKKSESIKIGIIVPLTGELGSYGKNIEEAIGITKFITIKDIS